MGLTVSTRELELSASGAQNFVKEHLGFPKTVTKIMYASRVLAILHLPVTANCFMHIYRQL